MAQVPLDLNVPFRPITWPQDTLAVPNGQGRMPEVDNLNATKIRREYFSYTGTITPVTNQPVILNIPVQKDGDFWVSSITAVTTNVVVGFGGYTIPDCDVEIVDSLSQYSLFTPYAKIAFLTRGFTGVNDDIFGGDPGLFITNIIEPYCFLRGGNISITATWRDATNPVTFQSKIWFCLNGWKEYAHAAR